MLDIQYRMHPRISQFPATEFYESTLFDGTHDEGIIPVEFKPPKSQHLEADSDGHRPSVIFLDHSNPESMSYKSRVNILEAELVASIVVDLLLHNPVRLFFVFFLFRF
jgi:superfamily I DNA and/or RNA helicase